MSLRAGLTYPLGFALLAGSLTIAVAVTVVPALAALSSRAISVLAWGLLAYAATVAVVLYPRSVRPSPALRQLEAIRQSMATRLADREGAGQPTVTQVLADALGHLDREILPTLEQVARQHEALAE